MAETYHLWQPAEAAQRIDLLAGFLATRHAPGPDHLAEPAECAAAGRAAVAASRAAAPWPSNSAARASRAGSCAGCAHWPDGTRGPTSHELGGGAGLLGRTGVMSVI